jgi:pentatricopeptide repeat protein
MSKEYQDNEIINTILIKGLCQSNKVDEAYEILEKMKNANIRTYNTIYRGCLHFGKYELTQKIYDLMKKAKIKPDNSTYSYFIKIFSHSFQFDQIEEFRKEMEKKKIYDPSAFFEASLAYYMNNDLEKSKEYLKLAEHSLNFDNNQYRNDNDKNSFKNEKWSNQLFSNFKTSEIKKDLKNFKLILLKSNNNQNISNQSHNFLKNKFVEFFDGEIKKKFLSFKNVFNNENIVKLESILF